MFEVRIHGRGGQGMVTAAELLSAAVFAEGKYAQAFPSFGSERTGAPVVSYCRIDDTPIRLREPVMQPDHNAVVKLGPGRRYQIDLDYCKGCGICAAECPCGAIDMVPERI